MNLTFETMSTKSIGFICICQTSCKQILKVQGAVVLQLLFRSHFSALAPVPWPCELKTIGLIKTSCPIILKSLMGLNAVVLWLLIRNSFKVWVPASLTFDHVGPKSNKVYLLIMPDHLVKFEIAYRLFSKCRSPSASPLNPRIQKSIRFIYLSCLTNQISSLCSHVFSYYW